MWRHASAIDSLARDIKKTSAIFIRDQDMSGDESALQDFASAHTSAVARRVAQSRSER